MERTARILGVLAALLLVTALALMVLPNRGEALVDFTPPNTARYDQVDCGTPFRSTRWSHDDGCEGPMLGRGGAVVLAGLGSVVLGVVAAGLWVASSRRRR
jgi:hypothetical protein